MFHHHHADRTIDRSERSKRNRTFPVGRFFSRHDIWKEYLLFLEHVWLQIGAESGKEFVEMNEFRVIAAVSVEHFVGKRLKSIHFRFGEFVMSIEDVGD